MHRMLILSSLLVIAALAVAAMAQSVPGRNTDDFCRHFGFDAGQCRQIKTGRIVTQDIAGTSDKELSKMVAMIVPVPIATVVDFVLEGETIRADEEVIDFGPIAEGGGAEDSLKAVRYTHEEAEEVGRLLQAKAGDQFNFSSDELAALKQLRRRTGRNPRDPATREAVSDVYRKILLDRCEAYRRGGMSEISNYDRGGRKRSRPREELTLAANADTILPPQRRHLRTAYINYPEDPVPGVKSRFFWIKSRVEGRPTMILAHRMVFHDETLALMAERQFYVGHTYNSMQVVVGAIEVDGNTVLFYRNRTSTDQVAGFGGGLKRAIGRGRMQDAIVEQFERLKARASD